MSTDFANMSRGEHPDGEQQPNAAERVLLQWFRDQLPKRLEDPDRIVTEAHALEFFEIEKKAAQLGCGEPWLNPMAARDRWLAIGGYKIGRKLTREYRKAKGLPLNPPT